MARPTADDADEFLDTLTRLSLTARELLKQRPLFFCPPDVPEEALPAAPDAHPFARTAPRPDSPPKPQLEGARPEENGPSATPYG